MRDETAAGQAAATGPVAPPDEGGPPEARLSGRGLKLESLHGHFEAQIRAFDHELVAYFGRFDEPRGHYGIIRYHFGYADRDLRSLGEGGFLSRGKRLRPILAMLFCRMFHLSPDVARVLMMATELMHSASLAHDDIEDKDSVRWGRPTVNALFGMERAINVGDALVGMVYQVLLDLRGHGVAPAPLLDVIQTFNATHLRMCEGQHWDLTYTCDAEVSVGDYLEMVSRKTASPCVCIADAISILAGLPAATRATLRRFGESLGMLYQICDDIRGIWCEPDALGRQVGQDVCQQRASLPLLYGFRHGSPGFRQALSVKLAGQQAVDPEDLAYIRRELNTCGADVLCHRDASHHYHNATDALSELGKDGPESRVLRELLGACFASVDFGA